MTGGALLREGQMVAGYRIVSLAGRGGTGEVYLARDENLERNVALKVLGPRYAEDPALRLRLLRESRMAAALDHPHVVPVYDAGASDGQVYVAMRYVDGTDLRALLESGPVEPARAVAMLAQVADALDAAHERGLVHRDIKPSNVLVDERGNCYLADFGLTQSVGEQPGDVGVGLQGTVDYVAPEQISGGEVGPTADVYSLGCLMVELLTGSPPFRRSSEVATLFAHLEEDPEPLSKLHAELPPALDDVVARALAKEPGSRPATCRELVDGCHTALGLDRPRWTGRRTVAIALAVAVVAAVAAGVTATLRQPAVVAAGTVGGLARIDAVTGTVASRTSIAGYPGAVAAAGDAVWLADFRLGALWRFQPSTGALTRVTSAGEPRDVVVAGSSVYVASDGPEVLTGNVARYDVATGVRTGAVDLLACAIGAGDGQVWASGCPFVERLSTGPGALTVTTQALIPFAHPLDAESKRQGVRDVTVGGGSLWVLGDAVDRRIWRLDPRDATVVDTIELDFVPRSLAFGGGLLWVTDQLDDAVVPIDPDGDRVLPAVPVGDGAAGVAADDAGVWVADSLDGTVTRVDPATRTVVGVVEVGGYPTELAVSGSSVWVAFGGGT